MTQTVFHSRFFIWFVCGSLSVVAPGYLSGQQETTLNTNPFYAPVEYNRRFIEHQNKTPANSGKVIYVSSKGASSGVGTQANPLPSLESARDAIRELKKSVNGLPPGGVQVVLLEGVYQRVQPFHLTSEDSGTRESPITYRGANDATLISGGKSLDVRNAKLVTGTQRDWLHARARAHVMRVTVPKELRKQFDAARQYGMVAMDGHVLQIAQWPNRGYNHIDTIVDKGPSTRNLRPGEKPPVYSASKPSGGRFTTREPLSSMVETEFQRSRTMHVQGYLHNDWYFQHEPIGDLRDGVVQLLRHTRYGIDDKIQGIPRRVRLVNVLAELDQPGEWYFDRDTSDFYFWPIKGFDRQNSQLTILGGNELIKLNGTSHIIFSHLTIENTGRKAISIDGGEHNLVAASTIRNGLFRGITISGGRWNGITGCDFHDLENAFSISGGDARSLERCYNFATNNQIHSCRRRGYGVVGLSGVGIYFGHNLLHDMNGAVSYKTIDSLLEFNEFYNIGFEMGDFNVAYCGAVWHSMNNVVRFNFVHHLIEPGGHPIAGFRNDDGGAGMKVYGNVFYRSGRGSVQFAGPLNEFVNNISLKSNMMWWTTRQPISAAAVKKSWEDLARFGRDLPQGDKGDNIFIMERMIGKKGWLASPWVDEFPELAKVLDRNPFAQTLCRVSANYVGDVSNPIHIHGGSGTIEGMESGEVGRLADLPTDCVFEIPWPVSLDDFVDAKSLNFNFKKDYQPVAGFQRIPFDDIGLVQDGFRPNPPDKNKYRNAITLKYQNDTGWKYDAEKVNNRYPRRSYE